MPSQTGSRIKPATCLDKSENSCFAAVLQDIRTDVRPSSGPRELPPDALHPIWPPPYLRAKGISPQSAGYGLVTDNADLDWDAGAEDSDTSGEEEELASKVA